MTEQVELVQVSLTPKMAAAISGVYMLHVFKLSPPAGSLRAEMEAESVPKWERFITHCSLDKETATVMALLTSYAEVHGL